MKAILLSAGQGRRLLPLTSKIPKCALAIRGKTLIEWQIDALADGGIDRVSVVLGYGVDHVEQLLARRYGSNRVKTLYNPFFSLADNLVSCWIAQREMNEDFILLNGDTLFEPRIPERLLAAPKQPVLVTVDRKTHYDTDDMKVNLADGRLIGIGKDLSPAETDAESIGMLLFRSEGPHWFRQTIERAVRDPQALKRWYLSIIDEMARSGWVGAISIEGLQWAEVDYPGDLDQAERIAAGWTGQPYAQMAPSFA